MHYWDCPPYIATPSKTEKQMQGKQLCNKKNIDGEGQTLLPFEPFMRNMLLRKSALVLGHQAIEQLVIKQQAICHKAGSN